MSSKSGSASGSQQASQETLVAVADLLFRTLKADSRFEQYISGVDLTTMAQRLHAFLSNAYQGPWPEVQIGEDWFEESYEDLAEALLDALRLPASLGFDILVSAFDHLNGDMKGDERVVRFYRHIQDRLSSAEEEEIDPESEEEEEDEGMPSERPSSREAKESDGEGKTEAADATQDSTAVSSGEFIAQGSLGKEVNVNTFDELRLAQSHISAAHEAWRMLGQGMSEEALGEAIYAALFEGAPALQSLFTTPRAVQAMKFMQGLRSFVSNLDDPARLKILVETLAFGHLYLDVTVPRVMIFRDALIDLFAVELNEKFTTVAREAWTALLNYVGGAIIYVKANYAELLNSWKAANDTKTNGDKFGRSSMMTSQQKFAAAQNAEADATGNTGSRGNRSRGSGSGNRGGRSSLWSRFGRGGGTKASDAGSSEIAKEDSHFSNGAAAAGGGRNDSQQVPTTYREMFHFNAAVMGFGDRHWFGEVLDCFHNIVTNVSNSGRLQEECDILALRIAKCTKQQVSFGEYKSCMLASLRSLLPKEWSTAHEVAWSWLWDNVERVLLKTMGNPGKWEVALTKVMSNLDESQKFELRKDIYARFFAACSAGQDYFKQSNTYLHLIAEKILEMTVELYRGPVKMVDDISALGLRHVGYGIPTELFGPFVSVCVESMADICKDELVIQSFRWSLGLIAKMLTRTITEGSTIVMKAINTNSVKQLQKAIGCAPRGERSQWMLVVQVGSQSISPLMWSLESGNLEAAKAMLQDLLTFRADRDRYYFGADELFLRHPNIVQHLRDDAPGLLSVLFDGLIWRSRTAEHGNRRVNYYIAHLLRNADGTFADTFKWVVESKDPKIVCHPVLVMMSDLIWRHVSCTRFVLGKSLLILTLGIFIASQSVLPKMKDGASSSDQDTLRAAIFACRVFVYLVWMSIAVYTHSRLALTHIRAKKFSKKVSFPLPSYLEDWQQDVSLLLTFVLIAMLCIEPILYCWSVAQSRNELFMDDCAAGDGLIWSYNLLSMICMFCFSALLIDLTVLSNRISAYVLVAGQLGPELALSLLALASVVLAFMSATVAFTHSSESDFFDGVPVSARVYAAMTFAILPLDEYKVLYKESFVYNAVVILFLVVTTVFLLNLLVAQLTCAYDANFVDMVGRARLGRMRIIVETMPKVPAKLWNRFIDSLGMTKKLEFNRGDVGVSGGIQILEPANWNPTTSDIIKRFGGSTSPSIQWPQESHEQAETDKFDRIERLVQKFAQAYVKGGKGGIGTKTRGETELSSLSYGGSTKNGVGASSGGSSSG
eukprot:CAMPEP_0178427420 /NCGR_PEP_ID=MMETSP0689_2-20121128/29738_1 /TAXON_ID=160604 /ORGANISM="Amphidinium massartii, Strain CS-259" /LENGTH=1286 /DNA_ID=CAMNT_0020049131 /DNA_START=34 /DNA_END=3894 /DNA_ORIENTATION=+